MMTKSEKIAMYLNGARAVLSQKKSYRIDKKLALEYIKMARELRINA